MKEYETLYLLIPDISSDKIEEFNKKLSDIVKNFQGQMLSTFNWGKRRLAYCVDKYEHGIYVYLNYVGKGNLVAEMERILKYDDNVLKYMTLKLDDNVNLEERSKIKREFTLTSIDEAPQVQAPSHSYN